MVNVESYSNIKLSRYGYKTSNQKYYKYLCSRLELRANSTRIFYCSTIRWWVTYWYHNLYHNTTIYKCITVSWFVSLCYDLYNCITVCITTQFHITVGITISLSKPYVMIYLGPYHCSRLFVVFCISTNIGKCASRWARDDIRTNNPVFNEVKKGEIYRCETEVAQTKSVLKWRERKWNKRGRGFTSPTYSIGYNNETWDKVDRSMTTTLRQRSRNFIVFRIHINSLFWVLNNGSTKFVTVVWWSVERSA